MRCVFNTSRIHILSNRWISDNYRTNFDKDITKKLGFFLIRLGSLDQKKQKMIIITQDTSWVFNLRWSKFYGQVYSWYCPPYDLPKLNRQDMHADQQVSVSNLLDSSSCEGQISFGLWGRGCNTFPKSSSCTGQGRIWQLTLSRLGCRRFLIWIDET